MREIIFRGKRIEDGEWVYGDLWNRPYGENTICIVSSTEDTGTTGGLEVIPETVGQYTGLKDKNGKKIFDGDVLVIDDDRFLIQWEEERGGFRIDYWQIDEQYDLSEFWPASALIGNVHDNPELVED